MVWPVDTRPSQGRVASSESLPPPRPGHADTLIPSAERVAKDTLRHGNHSKAKVSQKDMLEFDGDARQINESVNVKPEQVDKKEDRSWYPAPPKVLMEDPNAVPLELRSQIQLYATNECVA